MWRAESYAFRHFGKGLFLDQHDLALLKEPFVLIFVFLIKEYADDGVQNCIAQVFEFLVF